MRRKNTTQPLLAFQIASAALALFLSSVNPVLAQDDNDNCPQGNQEAGLHFHIHPLQPFISTGPVGYSPAQIKHAYGIDKITGTGTGQIIAVVNAFGSSTIQNDLNVFSDNYGIPRTTVQVIYSGAKPTTTNSAWSLESTLDVEWAHAIAPGATIVLVVANSASLNDLLTGVDAAVKAGAHQVSMSWGTSEGPTEKTLDAHFNKTGVTFTASSGDNGSGAQWPATSPYVTAVGGTTLVLDTTGNIVSEVAWSGSGGGISAYEAKPTFQNAWQTAKFRTVPDVAYNGDPSTGVAVYISNYNGTKGWLSVGGTSAGAPQWAALVALANSTRKTALNGTDLAIYSLAGTSYSSLFHDVTSGSDGAYSATARYDYVTGLGSPIANVLVGSLRLY